MYCIVRINFQGLNLLGRGQRLNQWGQVLNLRGQGQRQHLKPRPSPKT